MIKKIVYGILKQHCLSQHFAIMGSLHVTLTNVGVNVWGIQRTFDVMLGLHMCVYFLC